MEKFDAVVVAKEGVIIDKLKVRKDRTIGSVVYYSYGCLNKKDKEHRNN